MCLQNEVVGVDEFGQQYCKYQYLVYVDFIDVDGIKMDEEGVVVEEQQGDYYYV